MSDEITELKARIAELEAVVDTGIKCMEQRNKAYAEVERLEALSDAISYTAKNRKKKMHLYRDALQDVGKWSQEVQDELEKAGLPHAISMWRGCVAIANIALEQGGDAVKGRAPVLPIGTHEEESE